LLIMSFYAGRKISMPGEITQLSLWIFH